MEPLKETILKIGNKVWHPCSVDIIEHVVMSIRQFEAHTHYYTKSVHPVVGIFNIELILDNHNNNLVFVGFANDVEYLKERQLGDFVEGKYFTNRNEARLEFYEQQRVLAWSNMESKRREFTEAEKRYKQVELLVKEIKQSI